MVKLTEDMVIARSKGSDLQNIKKLNCWGSELTDVSVVRNLPNVEVLSMSVNQISTLEDFQYCTNLQELYIRKNNICDINEVLYLRQIPKLKSLWLADNPCADFPEYRMTVLRALPHLQKLDNSDVEPVDVQKAMVHGLSLPISRGSAREVQSSQVQSSNVTYESQRMESENNSISYGNRQNNNGNCEDSHTSPNRAFEEDDEHPPLRRQSNASQVLRDHDPQTPTAKLSPQVSSSRKSSYDQEASETRAYHSSAAQEYSYESPNANYSSPQREDYQRILDDDDNHSTLTPSITRPHLTMTLERYNNSKNNATPDKTDPNHSTARHSREQVYREQAWVNDSDGYGREGGYVRVSNQQYRTPQSAQESRQHQIARQQAEYSTENADSNYRRSEQALELQQRSMSYDSRPSPLGISRPYPLRPKTRNANVLSALLCLIKELDYSSLEVAEMAIRCRMEELDD